MVRTYTRYATRTGEILDIMTMPEDSFDLHNTTLIEGEWSSLTHYFANGEPTERPTQSSAIDVTEIVASEGEHATLASLPDPCTVNVSGPTGYQPVAVEGGTLQFSAAIPGTYTLQVEAFPFLPMEFTVNAV